MASEDSAQVEGERQRRIRAALVAVNRISTEALEAGVVAELVEACRNATSLIDAFVKAGINPANVEDIQRPLKGGLDKLKPKE